jgi:hypothetical protein
MVVFQLIAATLIFIMAGLFVEPIRPILQFLTAIYIGAIGGYEFKLRQDSVDDKISFRSAVLWFIIVATATFLVFKFV